MKLIKSRNFNDGWEIYQKDHVSMVLLDFDELVELKEKIEEIMELESQKAMKEGSAIKASNKRADKINNLIKE